MAARRANVRDLNRTRDKILAAALTEFSAKGFAGARVDAIARRARVNKRMLYYCFGVKQDLYREVLRRKINQRADLIDSTPDKFADALLYLYKLAGADLDFVRLMEWEAIDNGRGKLVAADERRALFEKAVARLRRAQRDGFLPKQVDLAQLFISMLALVIFPMVMPQMIRLITGMEPGDPRFVRRRAAFLRWIGERMSIDPDARSAAAVKANRRRIDSPVGATRLKPRIHQSRKLAGLR
ncbi:MAG: TetR family transcriptional regulator [Candidatus Binatus sp.]|uniref:TetR/AcrR family transcriptional regulator n=1 Tax=Candidatus Binatus sp. TaxID=2811406 RepID=UPI002722AC22|nr:TetR/AcrR family transcriptional regulator [Candidatus Binatus sp.]MDO8431902.1 TetR family transcriptional regulator [Candidatus Binatus sp.]